MDAKNFQLSYNLPFEVVMISMIAGMQNECNFLIFVHRWVTVAQSEQHEIWALCCHPCWAHLALSPESALQGRVMMDSSLGSPLFPPPKAKSYQLNLEEPWNKAVPLILIEKEGDTMQI